MSHYETSTLLKVTSLVCSHVRCIFLTLCHSWSLPLDCSAAFYAIWMIRVDKTFTRMMGFLQFCLNVICPIWGVENSLCSAFLASSCQDLKIYFGIILSFIMNERYSIWGQKPSSYWDSTVDCSSLLHFDLIKKVHCHQFIVSTECIEKVGSLVYVAKFKTTSC